MDEQNFVARILDLLGVSGRAGERVSAVLAQEEAKDCRNPTSDSHRNEGRSAISSGGRRTLGRQDKILSARSLA
jgi:hypothetical protein